MIRIYSFDPMLAQTLSRIGPATVSVSVPYEPLAPGPAGSRVQVVDFDGSHPGDPCFYVPVDLDDQLLALQEGLSPTEADPRFHQQMVYAVAMRVLETFDRGLGRRLRPIGGTLRMFPHAFRARNAFYSNALKAVMFGYFNAESTDAGANLPGQTVYTCLSHDIIAHETTHALVDRLRPGFLDATNPDVAAFHEGFADIVAVFLHFTLPDVLRDTIAITRTNLIDPSPLIDLAEQFGYATGRGGALRSAVSEPNPLDYQRVFEPHDRGALLLAAMFEAFFTVYQRRIADLLRLATGGTGVLPQGALHPDLVARVDREATRTASQVLNMCIRAFDYLPPVDITFGDFLRALVTGDRELYPDDKEGLRTSIVDAFRRRGIYPTGVISLADDSLSWAPRPIDDDLPRVAEWFWEHARALDPRTSTDPERSAVPSEGSTDVWDPLTEDRERWVADLVNFARVHAHELDLTADAKIRLAGFHPTFLSDATGGIHLSFVVQFTQRLKDAQGVEALLRGGTTLIADSRGRVRHVVSKPLASGGLEPPAAELASARLKALEGFLDAWRFRDRRSAFDTQPSGPNALRLDFRALGGDPWL